MIILDTTALLTRRVSIDHAASEICFSSLYLVHGIGTKLETKHVSQQVRKFALEKGSLC